MLTEAPGELSWGDVVVDAGVWILETGVRNALGSGCSALTLIRQELRLTHPAPPELEADCGRPSDKPKEFPDHGCKGWTVETEIQASASSPRALKQTLSKLSLRKRPLPARAMRSLPNLDGGVAREPLSVRLFLLGDSFSSPPWSWLMHLCIRSASGILGRVGCCSARPSVRKKPLKVELDIGVEGNMVVHASRRLIECHVTKSHSQQIWGQIQQLNWSRRVNYDKVVCTSEELSKKGYTVRMKETLGIESVKR